MEKEQVRSFKLSILEEIKKVRVEHPREADIKAKMTQDEDCFAMGYDAKNGDCKLCVVGVIYEGKHMPMNMLCKQFMSISLIQKKEAVMSEESKPVPEQEVKVEEKQEEKVKEKKASKRQESDVELTQKITELVTAGDTQCKVIATKLNTTKGIARRILEKLAAEGTFVKKQEGNKYTYTLK